MVLFDHVCSNNIHVVAQSSQRGRVQVALPHELQVHDPSRRARTRNIQGQDPYALVQLLMQHRGLDRRPPPPPAAASLIEALVGLGERAAAVCPSAIDDNNINVIDISALCSQNTCGIYKTIGGHAGARQVRKVCAASADSAPDSACT